MICLIGGGSSLGNADYERGFTDALQYIMKIFNKLNHRGKLAEGCVDCRMMKEVSKLESFAKDKQFEKIETELGYYLSD